MATNDETQTGEGGEPTQLPADPIDDPSADGPQVDNTLPGDLPIEEEEGSPDTELPPGDTGEPPIPDDGGGEVEVPDDAAWVGRVLTDASLRFERMTANPKYRGDPNTTMSAWTLSEIHLPHEQRAAIEAEAARRVEALRASGASERYIGKQLAGKIVNGKFD